MIKVNKLPKSITELEGELEIAAFEKYRPQALSEFAANIEVPGFRKGHVPNDLLEKNISAVKVLEKMAILALAELYPKLLAENKIDAIGKPEIIITKLAPGNPLGFKIRTAVLPSWQLPDYRAIAKKEAVLLETTVTDEEFKNTIETTRQMRKNENGELPIYNDEFVKSLGKFENIADFEKKLRENIKLEKEIKARDKRRLKIMRNILATIPMDLPQIIVDYELENLINQFKHNIEHGDFKFDDYLKNAKTDLATLRKNWEPVAIERAKTEIVISKISEEENLKPTPEEIEENLSFYAGTIKDKENTGGIRNYILNSLIREKVLSFLENLAK
ncbi:MAG TPA: trigger factor [Candidatus Paceibacterota bacterium]|nr:trigger factor [Candidatus Paceibacterota bacterium]